MSRGYRGPGSLLHPDFEFDQNIALLKKVDKVPVARKLNSCWGPLAIYQSIEGHSSMGIIVASVIE